jgi:crotonobetainyl-CoA:carnitine CoA-transferase CaiB-like acyl-CoA transferase
MKPLHGITVITLEHAIAAPFATRQLADLGARVIKIERPGVGDFARGYDERVRGLASHFVWTNRSKESLTLDVKHPEAQVILRRLILESADIVVQNLAPGAAARLVLRGAVESSSRIIVCDISVRRRRPLPRQESLRPPDPERIDSCRSQHRAGAVESDRRLLTS